MGVLGTVSSRRKLRYLASSLYNLIAGQALVAVAYGALGWSGRNANLAVVAIGTGPAYYVARRWVWQRRGRSHMLSEVVPFWALSIIAAALSTFAAAQADHMAHTLASDRRTQTLIVTAGTTTAYGVVFLARYFVLDALFRRFSEPRRDVSATGHDGSTDPEGRSEATSRSTYSG